MKLNNLIKGVNIIKKIKYKNANILNLCHNSNAVKNGGLFFCINGTNVNGETYAHLAVNSGAVAVVTEHEISNLNAIQIVVDNVRIAMSIMAKTFYDNACDKLKIVMVTGTNGKTSITYILQSIFNAAGLKCAIIGTNGIFFDNIQLYYGLTTPDPIDLHYYFKQLVNLKTDVVIMEASAHAIYLNKLYGITGEAIIFTNLTNEHLDFFGDMESYANVKLNYINSSNFKFVVANADSDYASKISTKNPVLFYGLNNPCHTFAVNISYGLTKSHYFVNCLDEIIEINSNQTGLYNVYNTLACITLSYALKIAPEKIKLGIENLINIPGRFNVINLDNNNKVIIDFAHTPDGFINVLSEIKKFRHGKIITLFGCVGYSDTPKRNEMGKIASNYSSEIIITSDNPNYTDFNEIAKDIKKFVTVPVTEIENRFDAIKCGIGKLNKNDTLVLLGKGAETHNLIKGKKVEHNDYNAVMLILNKNKINIKENA